MLNNRIWKVVAAIAVPTVVVLACKTTEYRNRRTQGGPVTARTEDEARPASRKSESQARQNASADKHHVKSNVERTAGLGEIGPIEVRSGYPAWYKDANGLMLQPCHAPDPLCPAPAENYDPAAPIQFPTNFPGESFWYMADAVVPVTGGGQVMWHAALEAAFANEIPIEGERIVCGRITIRGSGLQPGQYRITHPYGSDVFNVVDAGPRSIFYTEDIAPVAENFTAALASRVGPFLTWDPAVSPAAPTGYIGDPGVAHPVVGSPFGTNFVRVERIRSEGAPLSVGQANDFVIAGRKHTLAVYASHAAGKYNPAPSVKLGATLAGSEIRYSLDGTPPADGLIYSGPITLPVGASNLQFFAIHPTGGTTPVQSITFDVDTAALGVGLDSAGDLEGVFDRNVSVVLKGFGDPAPSQIKYTLDGTDPARSATAIVYSAPISLSVNGSFEVSAVAFRGEEKSSTRRFRYLVKKRHTELGPINVANGFPYWFKNNINGLKLQPCFSLDEAHCLPLGIDPSKPIEFPTNFPNELFYWTAEATGNLATGGRVLLVLAVEGAFINDQVVYGDQVVFGRIRVRVDTAEGGLHKVTHPFGVEYFDLGGGGIRSINFTQDIDINPGDFLPVETGRIQMLKPAIAGPAGFIANTGVPTGVLDGPNGTNLFKIERFNGTIWETRFETNEFTMTGMLAANTLQTDVFPASKVVNKWPTIKISASEKGATTWYTTDGSDPLTSATKKVYSGPFSPSDSASSITVRAVSKAGALTSEIATATYTLDVVEPKLTITPAEGFVSGPVTVQFVSDDPSATIYYTLDETDPRDSLTRQIGGSSLLLDPIPTVELRAVAQDIAGNFSTVVKNRYTLGTASEGPVQAEVTSLDFELVRAYKYLHLLLQWSATTTSGTIVKYTLQSSLDGAVWVTTPLMTDTTTILSFPLIIPASTKTMKFRVRAETSSGVISNWRETPLLTLSYFPETDVIRNKYNGTWIQTPMEARDGSARVTTRANDRVKFDFSGSSIAVIGVMGPNGGLLRTRLNNTQLDDFSMEETVPTPYYPMVIAGNLLAGRNRIELMNVTAGRELVFDGVVILSAE